MVAAFLGALMDLCTKIALRGLPAIEVTAIRSTIMFICIIPSAIYSSSFIYLKPEVEKETLILLIRSLLATAGSIFMTLALNYTDMGNAVSVYNTMPVFAGILSALFLKEAFTALQLFLSILSFIGVTLISKPPFTGLMELKGTSNYVSNLLGSVFALCCAFVTAAGFVMSREIFKRKVHVTTIIVAFGFVATFTKLPMVGIFSEWKIPKCGSDRKALLIAGFLNFLVQQCFIASLELEKAVYVTLLFTLSVFFEFILQYLFLDVHVDLFSLCGALLILLAGVGITLEKNKETTDQQKRGTPDEGDKLLRK